MNRRGFLGAILAGSAAPFVCKASSLMPIYAPPLVLYGDGIHDDTQALQAWLNGARVVSAGPFVSACILGNGIFKLTDTLHFDKARGMTLNGLLKFDLRDKSKPALSAFPPGHDFIADEAQSRQRLYGSRSQAILVSPGGLKLAQGSSRRVA